MTNLSRDKALEVAGSGECISRMTCNIIFVVNGANPDIAANVPFCTVTLKVSRLFDRLICNLRHPPLLRIC